MEVFSCTGQTKYWVPAGEGRSTNIWQAAVRYWILQKEHYGKRPSVNGVRKAEKDSFAEEDKGNELVKAVYLREKTGISSAIFLEQ